MGRQRAWVDIDGHRTLQPRNSLVAQDIDIHIFDGKRMARSRHVEHVAAVGKAEMALANGLAVLERGIAQRVAVCHMHAGREVVRSCLLVLRIVITLVDASGQCRINKVGRNDANVLTAVLFCALNSGIVYIRALVQVLVDHSRCGKRIASLLVVRAAGVVDAPAVLQDLYLGPGIVLDVHHDAGELGCLLQRHIDPADFVGSCAFVMVLGIYLGAIGLFVTRFPHGFKAPLVSNETHGGAVGVRCDFVVPFGEVEAPRVAAYAAADEPKSTQQDDFSAHLAQRGDAARCVEQIGVLVHNIGKSRREAFVGSLVVAPRHEHDERFFRVFAQKRIEVPDDIGKMHKVPVFFEQVAISVVDAGVLTLSESNIKVANAFEQLRGDVILLALCKRGLGLGVVVDAAAARIMRAWDAQFVEVLVVVDVAHPTWSIDVAAIRDPVDTSNRGIDLALVVTDKFELPRNALPLVADLVLVLVFAVLFYGQVINVFFLVCAVSDDVGSV